MSLVIFNLLFLALMASEPCLQNIQQLTFPHMGFEKAGEAYFSPKMDKICFQAVPAGEEDYQIFTLDLTTKEIQRLTSMGACTCSYFHPSEPKIIYAASPLKTEKVSSGKYKWDLTPYMNIYEASLDGTNSRPLTEGEAYHAECAYSPDGKEIVYASNEDGSMNLYVMNSDGTDKKQITHTTNCYNGGPFFSPDGQKIIFRADRDKPHTLQIYMIDKTGENLQQLTDNGEVNWAPFWHPSGKGIAFTSSLKGHFNYQIYFMNIESRSIYPITEVQGFNGLPVFSPDGKKLLWTSKRGLDQTSQIFIADLTIPNEWISHE